ncbi:hypothetical protein OS493_038383 [Desmophyllum pertusum]|uniref:Uncharacterized protein n=1 Tax=Desmophyllum pertusum TaxID=174260 RepID=A0A9X0CVJ2_9CNID|nr:hypothetical protein OS493_038383 [Desmophyllum pertusum]
MSTDYGSGGKGKWSQNPNAPTFRKSIKIQLKCPKYMWNGSKRTYVDINDSRSNINVSSERSEASAISVGSGSVTDNKEGYPLPWIGHGREPHFNDGEPIFLVVDDDVEGMEQEAPVEGAPEAPVEADGCEGGTGTGQEGQSAVTAVRENP